ncbi:MAG TPA: DUF1223 domain-containing protein [Thermomonas sp.]|jgi:hypothetical protein|uniref:DUF1223 domain-containing protein n=1 Tax=Thermomonas sp. TaxID=1971895 RepID=UPI002CD5B090|nr:DUF1223 domain-containing protein [Thermomonas sp.]HPW11753.1 DUF1223 domain-containing protein [Thermomonas sp.]
MTVRHCLLGLALVVAQPAFAEGSCAARTGSATQPLVELYTSEGCSSCPPADRWLSQSLTQGADRLNWLAFHVDYWDSIGWPDRFASPAYSRRQEARVAATGARAVYTPQVIVGSKTNAPWRNPASFREMLDSQSGPASAGLALRLLPQANGGSLLMLGAAPAGTPSAPAQVWVAQYQDDQVTAVRGGENKGTTLRHDRVVRRLLGPWPMARTALTRSMTIEPLAGPWGLVAFVQDAQGRTLQSLTLPASSCQ